MYDLIVIGGGSGGVAAAKKAADLGQRVLLCEADKMGGTCVSYGCVPKKVWHNIAHFQHSLDIAQDQGWTVQDVTFSFKRAAKKCLDYVAYLNDLYLNTCLKKGIKIEKGYAKLTGSNTVDVNNITYQAKKILVAVGSKTSFLDVDGSDLCDSSNDFFYWKSLPSKVVVVGGGYIAVELASILNALGVDTHIVIRKEKVLTGFDYDFQTHLQELLLKRGIKIHSGVTVKGFYKKDSYIQTSLSDGTFIESEKVLQAVGRQPNTQYLGCTESGVACTDRGAIKVDSNFQTSVSSIYAVGDCIDQFQLTPVAIAQARKWAHSHFSNLEFNAFFDYIPTAVFSLPEGATVGLTQEQAEQKYQDVSVSVIKFNPLSTALSPKHKEKVFMKLIYQGSKKHVVGAHIICEGASEMIQMLAIAIQKGITKIDLDNTMALHPSIAEELVTIY